MDGVERGRVGREARGRALAGPGAGAPDLLRYLAAEAAKEQQLPPPGPPAPAPVGRGPAAHQPLRTRRRPARRALVGLEALVALSAVGGGIGLVGNGAGIPSDWLSRTPFDSWVVPGLLLLAVVAAPTGVAVVAELSRWPTAYRWSMAVGVLQVGWILGQWAVLRRYFFLQPVVLGCGLLVMALAWWVHDGARPGRIRAGRARS